MTRSKLNDNLETFTTQIQNSHNSSFIQDSLQLLADRIPHLVWTTKPNGDHDYFNKRWYEYTGLSFEETKDKGWALVLHPEDYQRSIKTWNYSLENGTPYNIEYRFRKFDGSYRWFIGRALPMKDEAGNILKWFGTCTDIHEERLLHEKTYSLSEATKIIASSLDLRTLLENIAHLLVPHMADWYSVTLLEADGSLNNISIHHNDPKKIKWAKALTEKYPVDPNSATGVPYVLKTGNSEFYPSIPEELLKAGAKDEAHYNLIKQVGFKSAITVPLTSRGKTIGALSLVTTESGKEYTESDLHYIEELGSRLGVAVENAMLFNEAKEEIEKRKRIEEEILKINTDLEKLVQERTEALTNTNKTLEDLNTKLVTSNQELQDFAYVSSHDLQEPLRKITSFSNLLITTYKSELPERGQQYLDVIQKASKRMSTLISDILTYSRVTTNAQPFQEIDLNSLIKDVLTDLDFAINESNAEIEIEILHSICGDYTQVRLLIQNLISNAIKYVAKDVKPIIKVSSKETKQYIVISVKDNGIGFDEKYLEKIFTMFQRLHGRNEYQGTGIGLAISKKIVERHHGIITARSKEGSGSTFIIKFPKIQKND